MENTRSTVAMCEKFLMIIHVGCSAVFTGIRLPPYLSKLVNMVPWQKAINIGFTHFCATPAGVTALSRWATA